MPPWPATTECEEAEDAPAAAQKISFEKSPLNEAQGDGDYSD